MSEATRSLLAAYDYLDSTVEAIEGLRKAGFRDIRVNSPYPEHLIEAAMGYGQSPVRVFTLVGVLTGAATGFALTAWTSLDWPLIVGGKPQLGMPAYVVIAFELAMLFGALATVIGLLINARLPDTRSNIAYDPSFSADRFGVFVRVPVERVEEARRIIEKQEPAELREGTEAGHA